MITCSTNPANSDISIERVLVAMARLQDGDDITLCSNFDGEISLKESITIYNNKVHFYYLDSTTSTKAVHLPEICSNTLNTPLPYHSEIACTCKACEISEQITRLHYNPRLEPWQENLLKFLLDKLLPLIRIY